MADVAISEGRQSSVPRKNIASRRRTLVQNEQFATTYKSAGKRDDLALSHREITPATRNFRVEGYAAVFIGGINL